MEEEKKGSDMGCLIAFMLPVIIVILIFIISGIKGIGETNHEIKLLEEGKTVSAKEVANKFAESIKNKNYKEASQYLSGECEFYNNNGKQINLDQCLKGIEEYSTYEIEERGNTSIEERKTCRILCNGSKYENTNQIITLSMEKKVNKDEITYEIYTVNFTDNTL